MTYSPATARYAARQQNRVLRFQAWRAYARHIPRMVQRKRPAWGWENGNDCMVIVGTYTWWRWQ